MSMDEVLTIALSLNEQDRAALAHELLLSLSPPGPEVSDALEWEAAAMAEVQRRAELYRRGETTSRGWREALQDIQARLHGPTNPSGS